MSQVNARQDESFESLWRRFKRAVERENVLADLRRHEFFEKPSVRKKKKSAQAQKRDRLATKERPIRVRHQNFVFDGQDKIYSKAR